MLGSLGSHFGNSIFEFGEVQGYLFVQRFDVMLGMMIAHTLVDDDGNHAADQAQEK